MDEFIRSLTVVDIVIALLVLGAFVVGWLGGLIRQLLNIAAFLVAFLLAANLRDALGDFLARYWTYYDREFNFMLALLGLWVVLSVTFLIAIQLFYRRVIIHERLGWVDEVLAALLGAATVLIVLALLDMVLGTYYRPTTPAGGDLEWARNLNGVLRDSGIMAQLERGFIPGLAALLRALVPADLRSVLG